MTKVNQFKEHGFRYFLSESKPILVVTMLGRLDGFTIDALMNCRTEISGYYDIKYVVFHCRDIEEIADEAVGLLLQIQNEIRARGCFLNFSGLKPVLRKKLLESNAVRESDFSDNMQGALAAFTPVARPVKRRRVAG